MVREAGESCVWVWPSDVPSHGDRSGFLGPWVSASTLGEPWAHCQVAQPGGTGVSRLEQLLHCGAGGGVQVQGSGDGGSPWDVLRLCTGGPKEGNKVSSDKGVTPHKTYKEWDPEERRGRGGRPWGLGGQRSRWGLAEPGGAISGFC